MTSDYWSTLQLLSVAARAVQRQSAAYLKALGLPQLGLHILENLNERSPILQSELARLVMARTQTIGTVLTTLENNRWVIRQRGLMHNQVAVSITEQGRTLLITAQECLRRLQLPTDAEDLRPFLAAIINRTARNSA
ncbi:DNA-binding MarR family transcriptional regulator [Arthrobacter sp. PL16]|uniref:MarR family winged helix-turn-helix transcriptional regulator n=1 Tax=Arthrobacter sp. PL16 TaxID=3071720 RepID=UPI002DFBD30F|nr:DNA-binding MarR family transcriptional regulator [Arthrobacter sp. PL16]